MVILLYKFCNSQVKLSFRLSIFHNPSDHSELKAIQRIVFISLKVVIFYSAYLLGMFTIFSTTACHYFVLAFVASLHASNSHELA